MVHLVTDIGGTHIRIARIVNGTIGSAAKYLVADHPSLPDCLDRYCADNDVTPGGSVAIATAANPDASGIWRFTNNPNAVIDRTDFQASGWEIRLLTDDFLASAWGVTGVPVKLDAVRDSAGMKGAPCAILGPGTGLGLAYIVTLDNGMKHVLQTFGGHMLAASATDEQARILSIVAALKQDGNIVVPEDIVSGRGLSLLHRAVCRSRGETEQTLTLPGLIARANDAPCAMTLRLFHEFLGLFAHHAIITGHAFGGLYLDGGVLHMLRIKGAFDSVSFLRFVDLAAAPVVRAALAQTPVYIVDDPYIALRGLIVYESMKGSKP